MNSLKVFHPTWALQQLPVTMQLFAEEWRFLICSDGKANLAQIQERLGISAAEGDVIVEHLCAIGLLTETALSLEDFARSTVDARQASVEPQTFQEYLTASQQASPLHGGPPSEKSIPPFSPLQKPSQPNTPMSLQAVIQFILNHNNSDPTAGHFSTYRVFMGIGTPLLKRNGITSLRFQDDRIITDPELQNAIVESVRQVLNVSCTSEMLSGPLTSVK